MEYLDKKAVENFCEYLKIKTVHPTPDYKTAVNFLKKQAEELELKFDSFELVPENPFVFITWLGKDPSLKSIILNSHIDVVPVFPEFWKYDPFSAHIEENGDIYARGTQDMKCVGIQYLEAVRQIKVSSPNYQPNRTIHILFVPDEELGGKKGMELLVETDYFKNLQVGLVMDEGLANPTNEFSAFYGDRVVWWIRLQIHGNTGHGSQFIEGSPGEKMNFILHKFMEFRELEKQKLKSGLTIGDVTTVNLTGVSGGVQHNVVPSTFTLDFDVRITPSVNLEAFRSMIDGWIKECGENIELEFIQYSERAHLTDISSSNRWWVCFESVCKENDINIRPQVFPAGTDSRFIRAKGISAIGFSPINNTPILLHDHNEFINKDVFIRGIGFYKKLIPALAAVKE